MNSETQRVSSLVSLSMSNLFLTSTSRPNFSRKSAPMIGLMTSATMKFQSNFLRRPRSSDSSLLPYVLIGEPLAAKSEYVDALGFFFERMKLAGL